MLCYATNNDLHEFRFNLNFKLFTVLKKPIKLLYCTLNL